MALKEAWLWPESSQTSSLGFQPPEVVGVALVEILELEEVVVEMAVKFTAAAGVIDPSLDLAEPRAHFPFGNPLETLAKLGCELADGVITVKVESVVVGAGEVEQRAEPTDAILAQRGVFGDIEEGRFEVGVEFGVEDERKDLADVFELDGLSPTEVGHGLGENQERHEISDRKTVAGLASEIFESVTSVVLTGQHGPVGARQSRGVFGFVLKLGTTELTEFELAGEKLEATADVGREFHGADFAL